MKRFFLLFIAFNCVLSQKSKCGIKMHVIKLLLFAYTLNDCLLVMDMTKKNVILINNEGKFAISAISQIKQRQQQEQQTKNIELKSNQMKSRTIFAARLAKFNALVGVADAQHHLQLHII